MAVYIRLKRSKTGNIENLEIESYLEGVVNAELGDSRSVEALKAQAVAARTYALYQVNPKNSYDLVDTTANQAYKPGNIPSLVKTAVSSTSGMVLTYNNKLISAVYSSSNGGRIRSSQEVWGSTNAYLVSKTDPYTQRSGYEKYGHGVGMSQRGAEQAAKEGMSYQSILSFYYPGTALKSNYNGATSSTVSSTPTQTSSIPNKGNLIIQEAEKYLGMPYVWGGSSPSTSFDCSGYVYYVYKNAINYNWSRTTAYGQWKNYGRAVSRDNLMAGDLLFFSNTYDADNPQKISHVAIATGNGTEFLHASSTSGVSRGNLSNSYWNSHYHSAKRLLSDTETSGGGSGGTNYDSSNSPSNLHPELAGSIALSNAAYYMDTINNALKDIEARNAADDSAWDYGYLMDLTNGGDFKFHVPEFSEEVSATWDDITIIGRSVSVKAFNSTQSKSVTVDLTLAAGTGFYESGEDRIGDMLADVDFVKSLEYPDYSKAIVFPPATVLLYLNPHIKFRGVVTQVRANYKKPYDLRNRPMICELSFTVVQVSSNPPDYSDVRNRTEYSY